MTRFTRLTAPTITAALLALALVGCTAPVDDAAPSNPASAEEEQTETEAAPQGDGTTADWANPVTTPGDLLVSATGDGFQVDIYQVGVTEATKTGNFANPDTNEPIIAVGAEIVFVNYVFTNTGDADIPLSYSLVEINARYADWPYLQGMDSVTDFALDEQMEINRSGLGTGGGDAPFIWKPGTSFSYGQNFLYQASSPIDFEAGLTPALDNGDLNHDLHQEVTVSTTIK